jgi:ABC-2 type transport system permease protein
MVFGLAIILYTAIKLKASFLDILFVIFTVLSSLTILYSIWFFLGSLSIWFVKIYNITFVLKQLVEAGRYPMSAYPEIYRFFFTFVVPVFFLTTVPASFVVGKGRPHFVLISLIVAVLSLTLSRAFWKFALRHYSSTSS